MDRATAEAARKVAWESARAASRKCWWADAEELTQAALVEIVHCYESFDPALGSFAGWASGVARKAVYRALVRASAITSGHQHDPSTVRGVHRASVEKLRHMVDETYDRPDVAYAAARARADRAASIRTALVNALGSEECVEFAVAGLTGEFTYEELAAGSDMPVADVRKTAATVRACVRRSPELLALWAASDEGE